MIWNGNYGWLSPAVSLAWQRLEAFQRCRQRNCCRDKNIGGMTMVFIGRNQHSPRWWRGGGFVYLKKKKMESFVGDDISSNICFSAVWVCTFINSWKDDWEDSFGIGREKKGKKWLIWKISFENCITISK